MTELVADASAVLDFLLDPAASVGPPLKAASDVHFPALCDIEVAHVLRRLLAGGALTPRRASEAIADYRDVPWTRHAHLPLLPRILDLRHNFSAYDAAYVALAEALGATLLTKDARLAHAVRTHTAVRVEVH